MRTIIFCHFGEFGYELLSWNPSARKFHNAFPENDIIICCRDGAELLYPFAKIN